jgi:hypothetical protein
MLVVAGHRFAAFPVIKGRYAQPKRSAFSPCGSKLGYDLTWARFYKLQQ